MTKIVTPDPLRFAKGELILLDQRKIPEKKTYIRIKSAAAAAKAIKEMVVRGAPAIGIAAAYGMVLGRKKPLQSAKMLIEARPTAVNLKWAVDEMLKVKDRSFKSMLAKALELDKENKKLCALIAEHGAKLIKQSSCVMTHCNAGPLATDGIGTALGVIFAARKRIDRVYVKETRPRLQGARLTAWELKQWKIPCVLISDSMAAHIMKTSKVDAVIVGADRIASNGDSANKIGTYDLAISAKYHNIPFYIAAPYSTIDFSARNEKDIEIEERDEKEMLFVGGKAISAPGVKALNPSFDVTPAALITAIITERGVIKKPSRKTMRRFYS
ncbi:MAG: S-methyl-5-thioribose-1-phosphate isomerase [Elusimicrobiota bacterium]|nr:S-methyl-5-thioribose-1-phosphate isomerase [Elusimicrobiota bacterium]